MNKIILGLLLLFSLSFVSSDSFGIGNKNSNGFGLGANQVSSIIVSNGTGTFNLTDYCYANGTNNSGVDCLNHIIAGDYKLNSSGLSIYSDDESSYFNIVSYLETFTERNMTIGEQFNLYNLIFRANYLYLSPNIKTYFTKDLESLNGANISTNNLSANTLYESGRRVCLENQSGCNFTGISGGNMNYTNLALINSSNIFNVSFTQHFKGIINSTNIIETNNSFRIRTKNNSRDLFLDLIGNTDEFNGGADAFYFVPSSDNSYRLFFGSSTKKLYSINFANTGRIENMPNFSMGNNIIILDTGGYQNIYSAGSGAGTFITGYHGLEIRANKQGNPDYSTTNTVSANDGALMVLQGKSGSTLVLYGNNTENTLLIDARKYNSTSTRVFNVTGNGNVYSNASIFIRNNITLLSNNSYILPNANGTGSIGTSSIKWQNAFIWNVTTGDINFANGMVLKERNNDMCFYNSNGDLKICINENNSLEVLENVSAKYFKGDGSLLTGISGGNTPINGTRLSILNITEFFFNYNQTKESNTSIVETYGKWFYNMSDGSGSGNASWNETRASLLYSTIQWGYNMTTPFTNWLNTFAYNYNQTYTGGTYNVTYNALNLTYGGNWYNHTQASNLSIVNTYGKWFYNMSVGGSSTPNDGITIKYQNITNIPSCGANEVLTNRTGSLSCVTDQTGGGAGINDGILIKYQNITNVPSCTSGQFLTNTSGLSCATPIGSSSARNINYTTVNSINATSLTFTTLFTTSLTANTNYTYECKILRSSNATTSGIRYNISMSGVPTYIAMEQEAFTTATATSEASCIGSVKSCMPTAVTASLAYPTALIDEVNAYIETGASAGGQMNLSFSGELAGLRATVQRGSYCELKEI